MAEIPMYDPFMLVFIDETGCDRCNLIHMDTVSEEIPLKIDVC